MKIEGVTFVENAVKSMTKEEFIERHIKVLWQDRKEASRKKLSLIHISEPTRH